MSSVWSLSIVAVLACILPPASVRGQQSGGGLDWSFARTQGAVPVDSLRGVRAKLEGFYSYIPGVSGDGVRFDGYTTGMTVSAKDAGIEARKGFTIEAWVALNTYPWNWVPVVDQELNHQEGFALSIDAFGHVGLGASINGQWELLVSTRSMPLKKWAHIAGTYEIHDGSGWLTIYINGAQVGHLAVRGTLSTARADILIGRVREATIPFPEAAARPQYPVWYSLDGILDDVAIEDHPLSAEQIASVYTAAHAPPGDVLPWPKMPSGPAGPGPFGAYYATLHYQDTWDRLREIGPDSDVIVRFDESPIRLVFWQGTNYIPAWVTDNDKWYTDEFLETWGDDACAPGWDCEPMSDKQGRYSHVDIVESSDARAVVHWRYALAEVEQYHGAWSDPGTGWFDWADEYWTVYPDGIAIRKQVLHSTDPMRPHEWQETIVLHQPGSTPGDDIHNDAITLENMQGAIKTYTWQHKLAGEFSTPLAPAGVTGPPDPNIQMVNLKSNWKPFQIVAPDGASANIYNDEDTYYDFECWNHWPVARIASSDRPCVTDDRASHSSLSHLYWRVYAHDEHTATKILMDGLTREATTALLPLARSWLSPSPLETQSAGYRNDGYDPSQRAWVVTSTATASGKLSFIWQASAQSPLYDPAVVVHNWGDAKARLQLDGHPFAWGKSARVGYVHHLDGTDLVLWIERQSSVPVRVELIPVF
ncbi:MAG TPA: LamG domain-containing protein [Acidobacteriaceae bacterium]|nr:LamG domain-containing protein [Acidobacteriaceae bacterium]